MTISVVALARGGCSAHGGAWWNPRDGGYVQLHVLPDDELVDVVIQFPESVSSVDYEEDGIDGATPTISTNQVSVQFQEINPGGSYKIQAIFGSGATRTITFRANDAQTFIASSLSPDDEDDLDGGAWG